MATIHTFISHGRQTGTRYKCTLQYYKQWIISDLQEIINAAPTDGLWDDGRTDESQLGLKYSELEEAMKNPNSKNRGKYDKLRKLNLHKIEPIPVCKIPN